MLCFLSVDLKSLVHLKYCIKESLRLFPPVPASGRVLATATEIDGRVMPEGTTVLGQNYAVHHHPDFWENPDVRKQLLKCKCKPIFFVL